MRIGILGTGGVGQTLASKLSQAGHTVVMGTREVAGKSAPPGVQLVSTDLACDADLVINALNGAACEAVLTGLAQALAGTVLLDLANPLDFSAGFPPRLFTEQDDSLGERLQRALPQTRVVKSLNTLTSSVMLAPESLSAPSTVFVSGDDPAAKALVSDLLASFGWAHIIDLGGIETARGVEQLMPMWLQLMQTLGGPQFNWAIVR